MEDAAHSHAGPQHNLAPRRSCQRGGASASSGFLANPEWKEFAGASLRASRGHLRPWLGEARSTPARARSFHRYEYKSRNARRQRICSAKSVPVNPYNRCSTPEPIRREQFVRAIAVWRRLPDAHPCAAVPEERATGGLRGNGRGVQLGGQPAMICECAVEELVLG